VEFSQMVRHALYGNYEEARRLNSLTIEVHPWLYIENSPCGIKAALHQLGLVENEVRMPLMPQIGANYDALYEEVKYVLANK
jgi:4-hydroxy-tetrahydrodipicolinate synthase